MSVLSVSCNHCGAPLQIDESTRYLTCRFCSSQLEVQHSESAIYTKVLEAIDERTTAMSKELNTIRWQNDLAQLDRDWERERESYLIRGQYGRTRVPSTTGSLLAMMLGIAFSVFWIVFADSQGAPGPVVSFGVLAIVVVVVGCAANLLKSVKYKERLSAYERRREQLMRDDEQR